MGAMANIKRRFGGMSNWEAVELYLAWLGGASKAELRDRYNKSSTYVNRVIEDVQKARRELVHA